MKIKKVKCLKEQKKCSIHNKINTHWPVSHLLDLLLCPAALCPPSSAEGNPADSRLLVLSWCPEWNCWRNLLKMHRCNMTMFWRVFCQPAEREVNPPQSKLTSLPCLSVCPPWLSIQLFNSSGAKHVSCLCYFCKMYWSQHWPRVASCVQKSVSNLQ